jgi:hypothetical protein
LRGIAIKNFTSSTLLITLPSQIKCPSLTNNSLNVSWNVGLDTSSTIGVGNTTYLSINLGVCYISFFTGNLSAQIQ